MYLELQFLLIHYYAHASGWKLIDYRVDCLVPLFANKKFHSLLLHTLCLLLSALLGDMIHCIKLQILSCSLLLRKCSPSHLFLFFYPLCCYYEFFWKNWYPNVESPILGISSSTYIRLFLLVSITYIRLEYDYLFVTKGSKTI